MNQNIISTVIQTYNNSGKKAAKKVLNLLVRIHDVEKKDAKILNTYLKSYIV
jgi:hypothetical protein